ncbi:hypothetical protein ACS0TY_010295 [Phlomoides rotata]
MADLERVVNDQVSDNIDFKCFRHDDFGFVVESFGGWSRWIDPPFFYQRKSASSNLHPWLEF